MAEKPVIVPVELEVTDINMSGAELKKIQQTVNQTLAGLKKSVSDLFSDIDKNKAGSAIAASMQSVEKGISGALAAQTKLNAAMLQAGRSSEVFKSKVADIDTKIKTFKDQLASLDEAGLGSAVDPLRKQLTAQIEALEKQKASLNPMDYLDTATPESVLRVADAYRKVGEAIAEVNKHGQQFNRTVDQNKMTDEYVQQSVKAEELQKQMDQLAERSKKMVELGATDKQWDSLQYDAKQYSDELTSILGKMRDMAETGGAFRFEPAREDVERLLSELAAWQTQHQNDFTEITSRSEFGKSANESVRKEQEQERERIRREKQGPYTDEYKQQLKDLENLEKSSTKLVEKYERMQALGKATPDALKAAKYDADQLAAKLDDARQKLLDLVNEGKAFNVGQGDPAAEINRINDTVDKTKESLAKVEVEEEKAKPALSKILQVGGLIGKVLGAGFLAAARGAQVLAKGLRTVVHHLGQIVSKAFGAIKNMHLFHRTGRRTSSDLSKGFKKLQKNILMFGLGFRSAYYAVKRLRNIFFSAFKTLAQQSDDVNQQISGLVMSLNRLKGSLVSAFQPIANIAIPGLNALMDKLADAMEVMGKFFATMQGQDYIYKATAKQYDFVKSMNNKLGGYDKLSTIQDNASGLLDVTYDKASVEGAASNFAKLVKESWEKQDFTDVGKVIGNKIISIFTSIKDTLGPKLSGLVNSLASLITTGLNGLNITELSAQAADTISSILSNIDASKVGAAFIKMKLSLRMALLNMFASLDWDVVATTVSDLFIGMIENIDFDAIAKGIGVIINGIGKVLTTLIQNIDFAELATNLVTLLNTLFSSIDVAQLTEGLGKLIGGIITFVITFLSTVDWSSVFDGVVDGINGVLTGIGESVGGEESGVGSFFTSLKDIFAELAPVLKDLAVAGFQIIKSLLPVLAKILPPLVSLISQIAKILAEILVPIIDQLIPVIGDFITGLIPIISQVLAAIEPVLLAFVQYILPLVVKLLDTILPIVNEILSVVVMSLQPVFDLISPIFTLISTCLDPLIEALGPILALLMGIAKFINSVLLGIIQVLIGIIARVVESVKVVGDIVAVVGEKIKSGVEKLWGFLKGILNTALGGVESFVNGMIKGINTGINALNKLSFTVPSWVPGLGGKSFGFNLKNISEVHLPRLAQGAVIPPNKEFLAMLGDQTSGTNIEAPLDTIKQALAEVLAEVGGASHDPIILQLDGRTVAKVVWAEEEKRYKQTGKSFAY